MSIHYLILLALVQGITEFLPISSSAHLVLLPEITGHADQGLVLDVAVHLGTLFAVMLYFRCDILDIARAYTFDLGKTTKAARAGRDLGKMVVIGSIPVIIAGFIMHMILPEGIRSVSVIAATTVFFGLLLGLADKTCKCTKTLDQLTVRDALIIGLGQMLALVPGTSRSGITMTAALFLGYTRTEGARFSLLLGIPAILGAGALGIIDVIQSGDSMLGIDALIGMVLSFVTAYAAIVLMMRWLSSSTFMPFVVYRLLLGIALLFFIIL